jgi:hypothetical protein
LQWIDLIGWIFGPLDLGAFHRAWGESGPQKRGRREKKGEEGEEGERRRKKSEQSEPKIPLRELHRRDQNATHCSH